MGRPVSLPLPFADHRQAIQSIYWVTMIGRAYHVMKSFHYKLFQK